MKSIHKLIILLVALVSVGLVGCTEEANYSGADQWKGAQVYFPNTLDSRIELSPDMDFFEIPLRRVDKTEALSVSLSITGDAELFSIPATANFMAGSDLVMLSVFYTSDRFEYEDFKSVTISVLSEEYTTPYGDSKYTFEAGILAPWESLGIGTIRENGFYESYEREVMIEQNLIDPTRYRVINPFIEGENLEFRVFPKGYVHQGIPITMDGLVFFYDFEVAYLDDYQEYIYAIHPSRFTDLQNELYWTYNRVKQTSASGAPEVVQLAPIYWLFGAGDGFDMFQEDNAVIIGFPGVVIGDYSLEVSYAGRYTDVNEMDHVIANVELGEDVTSAKVALVKGRNADTAIEAIKNGTLESQEVSASGSVMFPCSESGNYMIVAVGYADDEARTEASASFKFTSSNENGHTWVSRGMATYTDDYVSSCYEVDRLTYEVEIEESEQKPGLFRLVNPYGESYPYNEEGDFDASRDYYLEINAVDPDGVYIELQNTGLNWGNGSFYAYSFAGYYLDMGKSLETVKEEGYCGTYANGVITFPEEMLTVCFWGDTNNMFYANRESAFRVVMPGVETKTSPFMMKSKHSFKPNLQNKSVSKHKLLVGGKTAKRELLK